MEKRNLFKKLFSIFSIFAIVGGQFFSNFIYAEDLFVDTEDKNTTGLIESGQLVDSTFTSGEQDSFEYGSGFIYSGSQEIPNSGSLSTGSNFLSTGFVDSLDGNSENEVDTTTGSVLTGNLEENSSEDFQDEKITDVDNGLQEDEQEQELSEKTIIEGTKITVQNISVSKNYESLDGKIQVKFNTIQDSVLPEQKNISMQTKEYDAKYLKFPMYEITSDMINGDFDYNLTLPISKSYDSSEITILYRENETDDFQALNNSKIVEGKTVTIQNLDHFTQYIVITPADLGTDVGTSGEGRKNTAIGNATVSFDTGTSIPWTYGEDNMRLQRPSGNGKAYLGYFKLNKTLGDITTMNFSAYSRTGSDLVVQISLNKICEIEIFSGTFLNFQGEIFYQPTVTNNSRNSYNLITDSGAGKYILSAPEACFDPSSYNTFDQNYSFNSLSDILATGSISAVASDWEIIDYMPTENSNYVGGISFVAEPDGVGASEDHNIDAVTIGFAGSESEYFDFEDTDSSTTGQMLKTVIDSNLNGSYDSGEATFNTIQQAIDFATGGETILVGNYTFNESVEVNKSLILKAMNQGQAKLDGNYSLDSAAFNISADSVTIDGFNISKYRKGITVEGSYSNIKILNNSIQDTTNYSQSERPEGYPGVGIHIGHEATSFDGPIGEQRAATRYTMNGLEISNNTISSTRGGISLRSLETDSGRIQVSQNTIKLSRASAILIDSTSDVDIVDNIIDNNGYNGISMGSAMDSDGTECLEPTYNYSYCSALYQTGTGPNAPSNITIQGNTITNNGKYTMPIPVPVGSQYYDYYYNYYIPYRRKLNNGISINKIGSNIIVSSDNKIYGNTYKGIYNESEVFVDAENNRRGTSTPTSGTLLSSGDAFRGQVDIDPRQGQATNSGTTACTSGTIISNSGLQDTIENLQINQEYIYSQNTGVKITFLELESGCHYLNMAAVAAETGDDTNSIVRYEFSSDMASGSFLYTLELPNPYNDPSVTVLRREGPAYDRKEIEGTNGPNNETILITLNHFTEFMVVEDTATECTGAFVNGVTCFDSIQTAINAALDGDTITVADGTFAESIVINKQITLQAANSRQAVIDGSTVAGNGSLAAVTISASNVILSGFEIKNFKKGVISEGNYSNIQILNNLIHDTVGYDNAVWPNGYPSNAIHIGDKASLMSGPVGENKYPGPKYHYDGLIIQGNEIHSVRGGIVLNAVDTTAGTVQINNNLIYNTKASGINIDATDNVTVTRNTLSGCNYNGLTLKDTMDAGGTTCTDPYATPYSSNFCYAAYFTGTGPNSPSNILIENNSFINNGRYDHRSTPGDFDGDGNTYNDNEREIKMNNGISVLSVNDVTIGDNTFSGNGNEEVQYFESCLVQRESDSQCYSSIQAGVDAVIAANTTLLVHGGTLTETIKIGDGTGHDLSLLQGLAIRGSGSGGVAIVKPANDDEYGFMLGKQSASDILSDITIENIQFEDTRNSCAGAESYLRIHSVDGLSLKDLTFTAGTCDTAGIELSAVQNISLQNLTVTNFLRDGILVKARDLSTDTISANISFTDNSLTNNAHSINYAGLSFHTVIPSGVKGDISGISFSGTNTIDGGNLGGNGMIFKSIQHGSWAVGGTIQGTSGILALSGVKFQNIGPNAYYIENTSLSDIDASVAIFDALNLLTDANSIEQKLYHNCDTATGNPYRHGICQASQPVGDYMTQPNSLFNRDMNDSLIGSIKYTYSKIQVNKIDSTSAAVADREIKLLNASGTVLDTQTTSSTGAVFFALYDGPANYQLAETMKAGWEFMSVTGQNITSTGDYFANISLGLAGLYTYTFQNNQTDLIPPVVNVVVDNSAYCTNGNKFVYTAYATDASGISGYSYDGGNTRTMTTSYITGVSSLTVYAKDGAGNIGSASTSATIPSCSSGGGGGGGGSSLSKDNCQLPESTLPGANEEGVDYSPSRFDRTCEAAEDDEDDQGEDENYYEFSGTTVYEKLMTVITTYGQRKSVCQDQRPKYQALYYPDIIDHKYEMPIEDLASYCAFHGDQGTYYNLGDQGVLTSYFRPDDQITYDAAIKILVNATQVYQGKMVFQEDGLYHANPYINLAGTERYTVYLEQARNLGILANLEITTNAGLELYPTQAGQSDILISMVQAAGDELGLPETVVQGSVSTRAEFVNLVVRYFDIQGDLSFFAENQNNLDLLIMIANYMEDLSPEDQIYFLKGLIRIFENADSSEFIRLKLDKSALLKVLYSCL